MTLLHTIWLKAKPPLTILDNLFSLTERFATAIQVGESDTFCPIFWTDQGVIERLAQCALPAKIVSIDQVHASNHELVNIIKKELGECVDKNKWLCITKADKEIYVPTLIHEEIQNNFNGLFLPQIQNGIDIPANLRKVIDFETESPDGIVQIASDVLRLEALALLGGMYIDIGDVALHLKRLPKDSDFINFVKEDKPSFLARQTGANSIENDIIYINKKCKAWLISLLENISLQSSSTNPQQAHEEDVFKLLDIASINKESLIEYKKNKELFISKLLSDNDFRNLCVQAFKDGNINKIYKKYRLNKEQRVILPNAIIRLMSYALYEKNLFFSWAEGLLLLLELTELPKIDELFEKNIFEKTIYSWQFPGLELVEELKYCADIINVGNSHPLYNSAIKELKELQAQALTTHDAEIIKCSEEIQSYSRLKATSKIK